MQYLVAMVGTSQILLGTDYPFDMGDTQSLITIGHLDGISDQERTNMHGETAARLYTISSA